MQPGTSKNETYSKVIHVARVVLLFKGGHLPADGKVGIARCHGNQAPLAHVAAISVQCTCSSLARRHQQQQGMFIRVRRTGRQLYVSPAGIAAQSGNGATHKREKWQPSPHRCCTVYGARNPRTQRSRSAGPSAHTVSCHPHLRVLIQEGGERTTHSIDGNMHGRRHHSKEVDVEHERNGNLRVIDFAILTRIEYKRVGLLSGMRRKGDGRAGAASGGSAVMVYRPACSISALLAHV